MSSRANTEQKVCRMGQRYGRELAAALVLASKDASQGLKRQMAQIVLGQIEAAVLVLKNAVVPADIIHIYEAGARNGVHDGTSEEQRELRTIATRRLSSE